MVGLALLLGFGGAIVVRGAVQTVNDRILGAASRAIAESLNVEDGEVALNLSPAIFGMLEDNARDNVYYSVSSNETVVTGYADLPNVAPNGLRDTQVEFHDGLYHGRPVRIVAEGRRLPGIERPVVVEVAETLGARERVARQLLIGLAILEAILIGLTAMLLPLAVRWGMRPLSRLGVEMDQRLASDLTPLRTDRVPGELRDLVRAFNGMLQRVDAAVGGMRRFTADASHQMRTPLSILRTHIALLRKAAPGSDEAQLSLDDIDQASERLQRLLIQLLALARADHANIAAEAIERVDADALAESVAAKHAPIAVRDRVDLVFERSGGKPIIAVHPALCAELLGNLLDNAIRYNCAGGHVVVRVERSPNAVLLVVEDDGPGIAPEDRTRAMTRFTRLDRDGSRSGSGLGLPIANTLAAASGATLSLTTPASGRGLRAVVRFPVPPAS